MARYVCVDVGGTFTDAAVLDSTGDVRVFKSPTTPADWTEGIIGALGSAAEHYGMTLKEFLEDVSIVNGGILTHGSTIATNAIIERKSGKVGVLCTKGFRDVFLYRESPRKDPFDQCVDYPEPFVPRYLTLPIEERMNSEGEVEKPLNEKDLLDAVRQLREYNVEAIAVCYLWSTVNPGHELKTKKLIHEVWPEITVVLSHEVNPVNREYRRWVAAAMDASLRRLVSTYANKLNSRLCKLGLIGELGMLNSSGGIMGTKEIVEKPLYSIDSGPAMAPVAGKHYAGNDIGEANAVVLDMGGTTFDVSCIIGGFITSSREAVIGAETPGISRVNVHSVGSGGGSIAWVDEGGLLRVGPRSAGSVPGPACYGTGGIYPTVTDANVVLGYINPDFFNDGKMKLRSELSYEAIKVHIADRLGISVEDAAYSIGVTVNANMITAIKDITIWQGIDPREFAMVAGGGACGLHAPALAEGLDMKKLIIPRTAGGLSAVGGVLSDIVAEFNGSYYTETRSIHLGEANKMLNGLSMQTKDFFNRNNISPENRSMELYVEGNYPFQVWELPVRMDQYLSDDFEFVRSTGKGIEQAFGREHERVFSVSDNTYVECNNWRLKAVGKRNISVRKSAELEKAESNPKPSETRKAYFKEYGGYMDTPIYQGSNLKFGNEIAGPAVIEEPTTTVVLPPRYKVVVTEYNNYYVEKVAK
jgi:N-methylhydantoinase A